MAPFGLPLSSLLSAQLRFNLVLRIRSYSAVINFYDVITTFRVLN